MLVAMHLLLLHSDCLCVSSSLSCLLTWPYGVGYACWNQASEPHCRCSQCPCAMHVVMLYRTTCKLMVRSKTVMGG